MVEIAKNSPEPGILQKDIARNQEISNKYLDHIIHALKASGLIVNARGRKSGYILTRSPGEITMYDIHNAFEPGICVIDCLSPSFRCDRAEGCAARGFWGGLNQQIREYFMSVSLQHLLDNEGVIDDVA